MTATVPTNERAPIERTEHPHVVKSADVLGGEPTVDGTRLAVRHILIYHRDAGESAEDIAAEFGLTLAQVHDALSYAFDHLDEIETYIEANKLRNVMREQDVVLIGGRGGQLVDRRQLDQIEIPPGTPVYTWETLPPEIE